MFTLPFSYVSQLILTTFTFPSAVQILENNQALFISETNAKVIAVPLKHKGLISEIIVTGIADASSMKEANEVLYDHLHSQALPDDLKHVFQLCSEEKGYSRMKDFGKKMLGELEQRGMFAWAFTHTHTHTHTHCNPFSGFGPTSPLFTTSKSALTEASSCGQSQLTAVSFVCRHS